MSMGFECYTLHTLMLILKEAIKRKKKKAPSASSSASVSCLRGFRGDVVGMKRCISSHLPCSSKCVVLRELP